MTFLKRLWLALRGGTAYKPLEQQGQWATWQLPEKKERRDAQREVDESEGSVVRLDERGD
jgi:hypothetical protein